MILPCHFGRMLPMLASLLLTACAVEGPHPSRITLENIIELDGIEALGDKDTRHGSSLCVGPDGSAFLVTWVGLFRFQIGDRGEASDFHRVDTGDHDPFGFGPLDLARDGRRLAIGDVMSGKVTVMDFTASATKPSARVFDFGSKFHGNWLVTWCDDDELLVWNLGGPVGRIELKTGATLWSHGVGSGYITASPSQACLLVPWLTPGESTILRASNGEELARFAIERERMFPRQFGAVSDDGLRAVVGRYFCDRFYLWRSGHEELRTLDLQADSDGESEGLCFLPQSHRLLIQWPGAVYLVDTDTGEVVDRCDLPGMADTDKFGAPWVMRLTPDGRRCVLLAGQQIAVLRID